jgi:hypothetical protein
MTAEPFDVFTVQSDPIADGVPSTALTQTMSFVIPVFVTVLGQSEELTVPQSTSSTVRANVVASMIRPSLVVRSTMTNESVDVGDVICVNAFTSTSAIFMLLMFRNHIQTLDIRSRHPVTPTIQRGNLADKVKTPD